MLENGTLQNAILSECGTYSVAFTSYNFYTQILCTVISLVGNTFIKIIKIILVVYHNRRLRTAPNYFIVNMALSDILASLIRTINLTILADSSTISLTTATILCKLGKFFWQCSYETSMLSLLVITIQKFIAVVFPIRARQEIAVRTRAWLIAFTISDIMTSLLRMINVTLKTDRSTTISQTSATSLGWYQLSYQTLALSSFTLMTT